MRKQILLIIIILWITVPDWQNSFSSPAVFSGYKNRVPDNLNDLESSVVQGAANNCATVAIIKLAIAHYGINNVFLSLTDSSSDTVVVLRNHDRVILTHDEINQFGIESKFDPSDKPDDLGLTILKYAKFCFAVEVKECMNKFKESSNEALHMINGTGINTDDAYSYIGIPAKSYKPLYTSDEGSLDALAYKDAGVYLFCNNAHAVIANNDKFDKYGGWYSLKSFYALHHTWRKDCKHFWAYKIDDNP